MAKQLLTVKTYPQTYKRLSKKHREILPRTTQYRKLTEDEKEGLVDAYNEWRTKGNVRIDKNPITHEVYQTATLKGLTAQQKAKAAKTFYEWETLSKEDREALSVQGSTIRSRTRDKEWYELQHYTDDPGEFDLEKLTTEQMKRILDEANAGLMEVDNSIYQIIEAEISNRGESEASSIIKQRMQTIDVISSVINAWEGLNE